MRLVSGHYFQDWLLLETDWNWRLVPGLGRLAAGGRRHRLTLARPRRLHHRACASPRSWPTWRRSSRCASEPTGPVETFSTERAAETVDRAIATEDTATILLRFENGARGTVAISQLSAGPQELARVRDRRLDRVDRLGLGAAGPAVDRPPRHGRTRSSSATRRSWAPRDRQPRRPAGRPRRGLRGHLPRALPRGLRRRRQRPARRASRLPDVRRRPRRDAGRRRRRRQAPATAAGRRSIAPQAGTDARPGGSVPIMRLGFLTAPLPDTPLMEVAAWAGANGFESLEIACWPRATGTARRYAGTSHIDVADLSESQRDRDRATRSPSHGLAISGLGYYPNPMHPDREVRDGGDRAPEARHRGRGEDGRPVLQHVHGRRCLEARRRELGDGAHDLAGHRGASPTTTA